MVRGKNADLIAEVARLYLRPGMVVADVTFGKGNFWKKVDTNLYDFRGTDLLAGTDFRELPYDDHSIDVLVLDPPYLANQTSASSMETYNDSYNINGSFVELGINSMSDVLDLYRAGLDEADRVVRPKGQVWVKCQDAISGSKQSWNHITIFNYAISLGWVAEDLFVFTSNTPTPQRWPYQHHAKKTHSYLWVFEVAV